jgi:dienelactone hydrolase
MPQSNWSLPTADGKIIYGLLNQPETGKSDKAVLMVHGMPGTPKEPQLEAAAKYFSDIGYDVIRPYLYSVTPDRKNCRIFHDTTLAINGTDIDTMMDHFAPHYKMMYGAAHSFGGPGLLTADTSRFKAVCLWDPTFKQKEGLSKAFLLDEKTGKYVIAWDTGVKIGQALTNEYAAMDRAQCITLAKNCKVPLRVVWASDGDYIALGESYHKFAKTAADMKIVKGTRHRFIEPGTTEPLLQYTREWFEKF